MAIAIARRLRLVRQPLDVVLTGGVFRTRDEPFSVTHREAHSRGGARGGDHATSQRPVLGAALIGLDALDLRPGGPAERRLRQAFESTQAVE